MGLYFTINQQYPQSKKNFHMRPADVRQLWQFWVKALNLLCHTREGRELLVNVNAIIRRHISHVKECSSGIQYEHTFTKHEYPDAVTWLLETQHFYFRLLDIPMPVIDLSFTSNRSFAPLPNASFKIALWCSISIRALWHTSLSPNYIRRRKWTGESPRSGCPPPRIAQIMAIGIWQLISVQSDYPDSHPVQTKPARIRFGRIQDWPATFYPSDF